VFRPTGRTGRLHRCRELGFDQVPQAYDVFQDPVGSGALEVAVLCG